MGPRKNTDFRVASQILHEKDVDNPASSVADRPTTLTYRTLPLRDVQEFGATAAMCHIKLIRSGLLSSIWVRPTF